MDEDGKRRASQILDTLTPGGGTNLWDGLHAGMEVVRVWSNASRGSAVLLLTDGCPNVVPPRGHQAMLSRYKDSNPNMNCSISTFGFGYSLDSELLNELAILGNGQYSFIPDAGFVGTTFVHASSNILSTVARRVVLKVSSESNGSFGDVVKVTVVPRPPPPLLYPQHSFLAPRPSPHHSSPLTLLPPKGRVNQHTLRPRCLSHLSVVGRPGRARYPHRGPVEGHRHSHLHPRRPLHRPRPRSQRTDGADEHFRQRGRYGRRGQCRGPGPGDGAA